MIYLFHELQIYLILSSFTLKNLNIDLICHSKEKILLILKCANNSVLIILKRILPFSNGLDGNWCQYRWNKISYELTVIKPGDSNVRFIILF